jgi:hypothetical protein
VEGDGGGEEVAVSGEDPGGESVGGGGISSAGVIGDWVVCGSLRVKSSKCSTSELASLRLAYVHCRHESLNLARCPAKSP